MKSNDESLSAVLKQWREIEPQGDLEANVWRQIRAGRAIQTERHSLLELIGRFLWQPSWPVTAALLAALLVGIGSGIVSIPRPRNAAKTELQFLSPGTLTGSYLELTGRATH